PLTTIPRHCYHHDLHSFPTRRSSDLHPTLHTATPGVSDLNLSVADVTQPEAVRQVVAEVKPDLVIHLAAQSSVSASWKDPSGTLDRKSTRLNSSHVKISYAVFCLKKK